MDAAATASILLKENWYEARDEADAQETRKCASTTCGFDGGSIVVFPLLLFLIL